MLVARVAPVATLAAAVAASVIVPVANAAAATHVELHAHLRHSATHTRASGHSEYERSATEREVEVTVRAPGLAGRRVTIVVNHEVLGTMRLSAGGFGHREWDTEHGQRVPFAAAGSPVRVWRSGTRDLVVSGVYRR